MRALIQTILSRRAFLKSGTAITTLFLLAACNNDTDDADQAQEEDLTATPEPEQTPVERATETPEPTPEPTPTPEPSPTPTPEPISYSLSEHLNEDQNVLVRRILDRLRQISDSIGTELVEVDDPSDSTVTIHHPGDEPEGAVQIVWEPLIPVVRTDQFVSEIQRDDFPALFSGSISNWQELGGQDREVDPVVSSAIVAPDFALGTDVHTYDELLARATTNSGMIALIPRSAASFHLQALIVDDVDPLRDELNDENWPWWERIEVVVDHPDEDIQQDVATTLSNASGEQHARRRTMVSVVGDVMLGRTPHRIMYENNDWLSPFPLVADELQKGDLTIGNLECAITDSFAPPEDPRTFSFMTFTDAVEGLQFAGFHALSGANNHALDFGVVGMRDTTEALEAAGIKHFGTGDNLTEAREPCLLEHGDVTFAFLGYDAISMQWAGATAETGGVAPLVQEYFVEDIEHAREIADVVIPYFHWGIEYTLTPTDNDRRMAYAAVEAGADLVLGGHPHWVQGMEIYRNTPIFYSTSNFVFDQEWSFETKQGFVLHLIFDGTFFLGYRVVPVLIEDFHRPRVVEDDVRTTILGRFWESSAIIADNPLS
jgi:poly-gamma-glutamate capsule biosynthesis protein CapA/YwtB (metallophosphatase superfamily)